MNSPMRMSEDCISLALDQCERVLLTIRPSPSNAASTVSFLSRLMWTYRVNPQTIVGTVVPTMSRTSGAFRFVVVFFVVQLKAYHIAPTPTSVCAQA